MTKNIIKHWNDEEFKISKREIKKTTKIRKCPQCGKEIKHTCKECEITTDRRGGWRQLGIYDG